MAIVSLPLPIQLLNGTVADAGQVMTDLNAIASNVNVNAAKNGVNSDITSLTALISVNSGVTATGWNITNSTLSLNVIDNTNIGTTQPPGTNDTSLATTAFVVATAFSGALPGIGPATTDYFVTNNGASAFWSNLLKTATIRFADSNNTTKRIAFDASQIAPNTTVTITVPGAATNVVLTQTQDFLYFQQGII